MAQRKCGPRIRSVCAVCASLFWSGSSRIDQIFSTYWRLIKGAKAFKFINPFARVSLRKSFLKCGVLGRVKLLWSLLTVAGERWPHRGRRCTNVCPKWPNTRAPHTCWECRCSRCRAPCRAPQTRKKQSTTARLCPSESQSANERFQ